MSDIGVSIIYIFIYRGETFTSQTPNLDAFLEQNLAFALLFVWFTFVTIAATVVAGIWSLVILSKTLGEVHEFSAWRGLATYLIPGIAIVVLTAVFVVGSQAFYIRP